MAKQNISNLGLGDIFEGIGNIINVVSKMAEEGGTEISSLEEMKQTKKARGVFSVFSRTRVAGVTTQKGSTTTIPEQKK
ncbi:MAG: hypothetical protein HQ596_04535 [Candidatus Saganbacteria bacterium]|nr:hypothetical protein [Candidatus Saganbacteria bacterium]